MNILDWADSKVDRLREDKKFDNDVKKTTSAARTFLIRLFRFVMIVGLAYVILGPLIGLISSSFFSDADRYNNMVFVIPEHPTVSRYVMSFQTMDYLKTLGKTLLYVGGIMLINLFVCSMVGYGFARFDFPFKKILFALVIVMIVIPSHTIMLPLYVTFRQFDVFGIIEHFRGEPLNFMKTPVPVYVMSLFGCGLRSGLYIYIFNQFFRGLPKEIEEAALVDGAGMFRTYFQIMLRNAMPSVVTVAIFSFVWQYNDTFYARLFQIRSDNLLSIRISTLYSTIANTMSPIDPNIVTLYQNAGIVLVILPVLIVYIFLQKQFIEGVERSGIVG